MGKRLEKKEEVFTKALEGKKVPVLTLDSKWYRLLDKLGREAVKEDEDALNELLRGQGKINSEIKNIKRLKKNLMDEIVNLADDAAQGNEGAEKKISINKEMIEECNQKMDAYKEKLLDFPKEIDRVNKDLMLDTMAYCYESLHDNTVEIEEIEEWVTQIRIELKKKLIMKQEKEQKNHDIYSYMNDIFGAEVMDLFDMTYNPQEKYPKAPERK